MPVYGSGNKAILYGSDHRSVKVYRLYVASEHDLVSWWKATTAVTTLINSLTDDYNKGFRRFCLYLPGGTADNSFINPNHWFTMPSWKRAALTEQLKPWIYARPDVSIAIYAGLKFNNSLAKLDVQAVDPLTAAFPDLTLSSHAEYFRQNWQPWFDIGINSLVFECPYSLLGNIRIYEGLAELVVMAYHFYTYGIRVGGGGLPLLATGSNVIGNPGPDSLTEVVFVPHTEFIIEIFWTEFYDYVKTLPDFNSWSFDVHNTEIGIHLLPEYGITITQAEGLAEREMVLWPWGGFLDDTALDVDEDETPSENPGAEAGSRIYDLESGPSADPIEGFGVPRYIEGFGGVVGDSFPVDYERCQVVCRANSLDGTFEFNEPLNKYIRVETDITNPALKNAGLPHIVLEDTMEWVNSGLPSSLSQVMHSNVVNLGIHFERKYPGEQETLVGPYQARYMSPLDMGWYDQLNSTVDFSLFFDSGNVGISLPYPACVLHIPQRGEVWVGGPGGVLIITVSTKAVSALTVDAKRSLNIKSMKLSNNKVYILDEKGLYIYDIDTNLIMRDNGLGLPIKLFSIAIMLNSNIVIGGIDGLYAKKVTQDSWQHVVEAGVADIISNPDACFAAIDRKHIWYSTEGFFWTNVGTMPSGIEINKIEKHRSQLYIGTNRGLYEDNGSFYSGSVSVALLDVLGDAEASAEVIVNDVASNFSKAVFGISDGRHIVLSDVFTVIDTSEMGSVHKVLIVDDDIWLFGYDSYRVMSEALVVRRLATGDILT